MSRIIIADLIVFDLDGTLADSLPDIANAANFACLSLGLPQRSREEIKGMIGGGERKFVERFVGPDHQNLVKPALKLYLHHYHRHVGDLTRLYPEVKETLEALSRIKLAVLSNKRQDLTEEVLRVLGILPHFTMVRGGGAALALKPSPQPLLALLKDLKVQPGRALMVGDKIADIVAGRGAGVFTAAVTYGYGELPALEAASPDVLLARFSELKEIIAL